MDKPIVILLLRRDEDTLTELERRQLDDAFDGQGARFKFIRVDSVDYEDHAALCRKHQPACVVLPLERPIPAQAMEEGFAHITFGRIGLVELLPLVVRFKDFKPREV